MGLREQLAGHLTQGEQGYTADRCQCAGLSARQPGQASEAHAARRALRGAGTAAMARRADSLGLAAGNSQR